MGSMVDVDLWCVLHHSENTNDAESSHQNPKKQEDDGQKGIMNNSQEMMCWFYSCKYWLRSMAWRFVSPRSHMLNPNLQSDIWRWELWWLDHEGSTLMNGISALLKETPKCSLSPSVLWGHGEKSVCLWTGEQALNRYWICWHLDLEHPRLQHQGK